MKKFTLLILYLFIGIFVFAQKATVLLTENFSGGVPPAGWTIDDQAAQWSQSSSANAGGTAPEAKLTWVSGTHTTHLISPVIDLTGLSTVIFSFKHFLDDYSGSGYTIGVATRSGGGSWNDVWTVNPTDDMGPETKDIIISNADVGTSDFQICIYFSGDMYNFDFWYIDDVQLVSPDNTDAAMESINVSPYAAASNIDIKCTFKNIGLTNLTSTDINYQIDNGTIVTENLSGLNLTTTQTNDYIFSTQWSATPGSYNLKVWVSDINGNGNDDDQTNDTLNLSMYIATQSVSRTPLYEEFTSSTCGPCATFNSNYFTPNFLANNEGNYSLIKYQMSWPSPGDPYYTAEGGVRRVYYGVSGVPTLFIDANEGTHFNSAQLQADLDNELSVPAFFNISATANIVGTTIDINADIIPYLDASDFTVQIAVVEKVTTGNTGNNGETEFHNVMMKMLPDASGTAVSFTSGTPENINLSTDLSSTFVEKYSDLEVVVFIQNNATKEVFQSKMIDAILEPAAEIMPSDGSTNVNPLTDIVITLNQPMRKIDDSEITDADISSIITLTDPSKGAVAYTGTINTDKTVIIINPDDILNESADITVTLLANSIESINDDALAETGATFTTSAYPVSNVIFSPADGATDVNFTSNITLTFDNAMRKIDDSEITDADISAFVTLTDPSKGDIAFTGTINAAKTVITVNPDNDLPELTDITVTVAGDNIENEYNQALSEATATFTTKSTIGISDYSDDFKISPNPAQDFIRISGLAHAKIVLTNISGKQVLSQTVTSDNEQINIQRFASGIYILKIISEGKTYTEKIIKK